MPAAVAPGSAIRVSGERTGAFADSEWQAASMARATSEVRTAAPYWITETSALTPAPANAMPFCVPGSVNVANSVPAPVAGVELDDVAGTVVGEADDLAVRERRAE